MLRLLDRYESTSYEPPAENIRLTIEAGRADMPQLAQWIRDRMDIRAYYEFLREVFLPLSRVDFSLEHDCLVSLPVRLWMTTNYDTCLGEALARRLGRNVTPVEEIPFQELLGGRESLPKIVHLHGWAGAPDKIVLTADDYDRLYRRETRRTHELGSLAAFTLLFVGYSLEDRELKYCLETTQARLGHYSSQHFAILPRRPEESGLDVDLRVAELRRRGVQPIFYPCTDGNHSARLEILRHLLDSLTLPQPAIGEQLELSWAAQEISFKEIRQALGRLANSAGSAVDFILRSCSWKDRLLTLSSHSTEEISRLAVAADSDSFWHEKSTVASSRSTPKATMSQPPQSDPSQLAEEGLRASEAIQTSALSGQMRDQRPAAEVHLEMLRRDALGQLEPSNPPYRHVLPLLMPPPLPYGLSDLFHPILDWRLDSPVVHVWIYSVSPATPDELSDVLAITAVGLGPLHVREELESTAYTAALSMPFDGSSVITRGLIHLALPEAYNPSIPTASILAQVAGKVFGGGSRPVPLSMPSDLKESLRDFRAACERMAQNNGFVRIHDIPHSSLRDFQALLLRHLVGTDRAKAAVILRAQSSGGVLKCLAYPRFPKPLQHPRLSLRCSGELLRAPVLQQLLEAYFQNVMTRLRADLERRIEFWTQELEGDEAGVRWFRNLSSEERAKVPDVVAERVILDDLAVSVQTIERKVPAEEYYLRNITNYQIPREKKILQSLQASREPLARLAETDDSPIRNRCLARIFDCALRQVSLCDDSRLNSLFGRWSSQVDGFLRVEWTKLCEQLGISSEDVFKRTTYFSIDLRPEEDVLEIFPNALIDSSRATVIFDARRGTLVVEDPLDFATSVEIEERVPEGCNLTDSLERLLATQPGDSGSMARRLQQEIFQKPSLAGAICDGVLKDINGADHLAEIRTAIRSIWEEATAGYRGIYQLMSLCPNTAEEILRPWDAMSLDPPAGKSLALAFMLCMQAGLSPLETLRTLRDRPGSYAPPEVKREFGRALLKDRALVNQFLEAGVIGMDQISLRPEEEAALKVEQCLEAAQLAEKFRLAAERLDPTRETLGSVFLRSEEAFESAHAAVFTRPPPGLLRIQRVLSGEPLEKSTGEDS